MKAVICDHFGPIEDLYISDLPDPVAGADEVVIAVKAAALNFFDGLMVQGKYQTKPPFPFSPGSEAAGVVLSVGANVSHVKPGDRVATFCGTGGYAEQVRVKSEQVFHLPESLGFKEAAAALIVYGTSYHGLKDRADLQPGETLLVLGAAGGVGLTAVELGKLLGARVIAAASTDAKLDLARDYGADETINYSTEDLRTRLKELTNGQGVDVVYDPVGGDKTETAIRSLAWGGRHLVIGFAAGDIPKIPANLLLLKSADIRGVLWGAATKKDPVHHAANIEKILSWCASGTLRPHISQSFPLAQFVDALNHVMSGKAQGKIILELNS